MVCGIILNIKVMVKMFLQLIESLGISQRTISYIITIVITVLITVPVQYTIQSATEVKTTLDTVVVNQRRLEQSLTKVFESVGDRLSDIEERQQSFMQYYIYSEDTQNEIILDLSQGTQMGPVYDERIRNLNRQRNDLLENIGYK